MKALFLFQYSKKGVAPLIKPWTPCLVSEGLRNPLNRLPKSQMEFHETKRHTGRYSEGFRFELWPDRWQHFSSIWSQLVSLRTLVPKYSTILLENSFLLLGRQTGETKDPDSGHRDQMSPKLWCSHRTNRKTNPRAEHLQKWHHNRHASSLCTFANEIGSD